MTISLWQSVRGSRTPVTFVLLAIIGVVYIAQLLLGDSVMNDLGFYAPFVAAEPWRVVTAAFVHSGIMHVMFNAYSLWVLGNIIERVLGSAKFLLVFGVSVIAGCLAVAILSPDIFTVGASGGIFGLFAALFIINRGFGGSNVSLLVIIGLNLAIGFIVPGIAWQAHLGGLLGGLAATLFVAKRRRI